MRPAGRGRYTTGEADVTEYRYRFFVDAMHWAGTFAREQWYFILLGVVVLIMLWWSVRR